MKKDSEIKLLRGLKECLQEVGIYDRAMLGFGTCLGAVRPSKGKDFKYRVGLIPWDKDCDLIINEVSPEKKEEYFELCKKRGLFKWKGHPSARIQRKRDGEILWFSAKQTSSRCCNWFSWTFKDISWHSKGKMWTVQEKFDMKKFNYDHSWHAIAKGTPAKYYESLTEIAFEGMKFNIPTRAGGLMDLWYPGWAEPRKGGASKKDCVMLIKKWENPKTWRIR